MNFNAEVKQIDDNDLDILFGGSSKKTDLALSSLLTELESGLDSFFGDEEKEVEKEVDETLGALIESEEKEEKLKVVEKQKKVKELKVEASEEKNTEDLFSEDKEEVKTKETTAIKEIVDYLIEKDIWFDFDGRDEVDYNEDTFKTLIVAQSNFKAQEMFNELLDQTGEYGKAIIEHVRNNGNLDEIIDLFKLEKETEAIDISSLEGQEKLIYQYYSEDEIGWSKEKIKRYIDSLKIDDELESEAKDIKTKYDKLFNKRLEQINQEQEFAKQEQQEKIQQYKSNVVTTLKQRSDLSDKEKTTIADYMLNYDQKLDDGQLVNKFYVKFTQMQSNLNDFIDLVNFVMDKENYLKKINTKAETKATKKTFEFIKSGNALNNKNSGVQATKLSADDDATNLFKLYK